MKRNSIVTAVFVVLIIILSALWSTAAESRARNTVVAVDRVNALDYAADTTGGQLASDLIATATFENEAEVQSCIVYLLPIGETDNEPNYFCPEDGRLDAVAGYTALTDLWAGTYYSNQHLVLVTSHSAGCTDGSRYQIPDLGTFGWNNIASSVSTNVGAGCTKTTLYDYTGYGGALIMATPSLPLLGVMDNAAESVKIQ